MAAAQTIKDLFNDALDRIGDDARAEYLRHACAGDEALMHQVMRLLAAHDRGNGFLDAPTRSSAVTHECPGSCVGNYQIIEQIGEGGFGVVFQAQQETPVKRRVALKVLKAGMETREVIARFETERAALALMDHPNIARVLDAGATAGGRPYFVMELVRGAPITSYCHAEGLSLTDRLELFQNICHGVQHAHHKGIIHRDLKPSNILVAEVDGRATPKIIDFGIAKAIGEAGLWLTQASFATDIRQLVGTPEYMSPEQAGTGAGDIDTRSDIYSLGVLLYELLTDLPPFDPVMLRSVSWDEMRRMLREEDPPRPSTRVTAARERRTPTPAGDVADDGRALAASLRGDLDWIVMKCLEKDRSRRYQTASALAVDIQRHLDGEPILAAPPDRVYRLRKFLRRHRSPVIAGTLVVASLVTAVIGTTTFAVRAERQRTLAERSARETNQVADFQASMLAQINVEQMGARLREDVLDLATEDWRRAGLDEADLGPHRADLDSRLAGAWFTTATLRSLDENVFRGALAAIERDFAGQPLVKARLLQSIADTMRTLGLFDQAMAPQTQALEIRRTELSPDHLDTLASLAGMAALLTARFRFEDAEPYARAALDGRRRTLAPDHPDTLASTLMLGYVLQRQYRFAEAEPYHRSALAARRRTLGDNHRDTLTSIYRLGQMLLLDGRLSEAEPLLLEALQRSRELPGETADLMAQVPLANLRRQQGRLAEAESLWLDALERLRTLKGDDFRDTLFVRCKLASLLLQQGRLDEAEVQLSHLAQRRERVLGETHPDSLESMRMMSELRERQGRLLEAASGFCLTLERFCQTLGPAQRDTLVCAAQYAGVLDALGRTDDAMKLRADHVRQTLQALRDWPGPATYPGLAEGFYRLIRMVRDEGALQRECIETFRAKYGSHHPTTLATMERLAWHLWREGRFDEAEPLARASLEGCRSALPSSAQFLRSLNTLAIIVRDAGRWAEALTWFEEHEEASPSMSSGGARDPAARIQHAECLVLLQRFAEAERQLLAAHDTARSAASSNQHTLKLVLEALIRLSVAWHAAQPNGDHHERVAKWRAELSQIEPEAPRGAPADPF